VKFKFKTIPTTNNITGIYKTISFASASDLSAPFNMTKAFGALNTRRASKPEIRPKAMQAQPKN